METYETYEIQFANGVKHTTRNVNTVQRFINNAPSIDRICAFVGARPVRIMKRENGIETIAHVFPKHENDVTGLPWLIVGDDQCVEHCDVCDAPATEICDTCGASLCNDHVVTTGHCAVVDGVAIPYTYCRKFACINGKPTGIVPYITCA